MSNLRKGHVTLLIVGVKGHTCAYFCNTGRDHQKPAPRHVRWEFQPNIAVHIQSLSALADRTGARIYIIWCIKNNPQGIEGHFPSKYDEKMITI